jgi:hypothetical protein
MKRIVKLLTVVALAASSGASFPADAQTAAQSGGQTEAPGEPHGPHASGYADPLPSRATQAPPLHAQFHPPPLRPTDPNPQHLHGPTLLLAMGC